MKSEASEELAPREPSRKPPFNQQTIEEQRTRLAQLVMAQMERNDLAETDKIKAEVIELYRGSQSVPPHHR